MSLEEVNKDASSDPHPRERFENYICDVFAREIQSWDRSTSEDIYAISFFIYDYEDDPLQPQVNLSYNKLSEWERNCTRETDRSEVKWNFAFWPQDFKAIIPMYSLEGSKVVLDSDGAALRSAWLDSEGLNDSNDGDPGSDTPVVTRDFAAICVRVARRLHESGIITAKFGRTVPIIVHELEYYDAIVEQTRDANPPGASDEFDLWYNSLG